MVLVLFLNSIFMGPAQCQKARQKDSFQHYRLSMLFPFNTALTCGRISPWEKKKEIWWCFIQFLFSFICFFLGCHPICMEQGKLLRNEELCLRWSGNGLALVRSKLFIAVLLPFICQYISEIQMLYKDIVHMLSLNLFVVSREFMARSL